MKIFNTQDMEALPVIGQGASGVVFGYEEGTVLKLYRDTWTEAMVSSAYTVSDCVCAGGVTTAAPRELVKCGSRYGIIFDRLDGKALPVHIGADIEKRYASGERMGRMLAAVHGLKADSGVFPSLHTMFSGILERISGYFTEEQIRRFFDFLDSLPGGCCVLHGDFHENNILVCGDEFYLIDLDSMCIGSPVFDLMQTYCTYRTPMPEEYRRYMNLTDEALNEFLLKFLGSYFSARCGAVYDPSDAADRAVLIHYDELFTGASAFMRFFAPLYMNAQPAEQLREYVSSTIGPLFDLMGKLEKEFVETELPL